MPKVFISSSVVWSLIHVINDSTSSWLIKTCLFFFKQAEPGIRTSKSKEKLTYTSKHGVQNKKVTYHTFSPAAYSQLTSSHATLFHCCYWEKSCVTSKQLLRAYSGLWIPSLVLLGQSVHSSTPTWERGCESHAYPFLEAQDISLCSYQLKRMAGKLRHGG